MASFIKLVCTECGYEVETSGLHEFYRDKSGKRKLYGHPIPTSKEAEERGIYGFSAELYCPICDEVFDLIVVEYKRPCKEELNYLKVWFDMVEPKDEYREDDEVRCPKCGNTELILEPEEDEEVKCPRCKRGILKTEYVVQS